jgi:hypothetical protein
MVVINEVNIDIKHREGQTKAGIIKEDPRSHITVRDSISYSYSHV